MCCFVDQSSSTIKSSVVVKQASFGNKIACVICVDYVIVWFKFWRCIEGWIGLCTTFAYSLCICKGTYYIMHMFAMSRLSDVRHFS